MYVLITATENSYTLQMKMTLFKLGGNVNQLQSKYYQTFQLFLVPVFMFLLYNFTVILLQVGSKSVSAVFRTVTASISKIKLFTLARTCVL